MRNEVGTYYKLRSDVPNPNVDRRSKRDWTKVETFKAGEVFCIGRYDIDATHVTKVGAPYSASWNSELRTEVMRNADVVPESPLALVERLGPTCMDNFVVYMLERGVLTAEQVETQFRAWEQS